MPAQSATWLEGHVDDSYIHRSVELDLDSFYLSRVAAGDRCAGDKLRCRARGRGCAGRSAEDGKRSKPCDCGYGQQSDSHGCAPPPVLPLLDPLICEPLSRPDLWQG